MGKKSSGSLFRQAACDPQLAEARRAVMGEDIIDLRFAVLWAWASRGVQLTLSSGDRLLDAGGVARGDCAAPGQEFTGVVEDDDTVA